MAGGVPKKRLSAATLKVASMRQAEVEAALKKSAITPTTVVRATKKMLKAKKKTKSGDVPDWFSRKAAIEILCKLMRLLDGPELEPIDTDEFERNLRSKAALQLFVEMGRQGKTEDEVLAWATTAEFADALEKRKQELRTETDNE